jgi:hypothetical protein
MIDILHHIGLINPSLEQSAACYEKLGFTLTPLSIPRIVLEPGGNPEPLGAGNRHAIFDNNYLELLGIVDPERWAAITPEQRGPYDLDKPLSRHEGLHVMHFGTNQIEKEKARLDEQGIACSPIKTFQRNVQTATGEKTMQARTIHFPPQNNPEGLIQIAQHDTPELIFLDRYQHHKNGAKALNEIIIVTETPADLAARYEGYSGHECHKFIDNHLILDLGSSSIRIVDPECLNTMIPGYKTPALPFMAAFTVTVADLQGVCKVLTENNVPFIKEPGSVVVYPEYACGCAVIFETKN